MSTEEKLGAVRLKTVADRVAFEFIEGEFDGICYRTYDVIHKWENGKMLGVLNGLRCGDPLVVVNNDPPNGYLAWVADTFDRCRNFVY